MLGQAHVLVRGVPLGLGDTVDLAALSHQQVAALQEAKGFDGTSQLQARHQVTLIVLPYHQMDQGSGVMDGFTRWCSVWGWG